jgi:lysozyme family protein
MQNPSDPAETDAGITVQGYSPRYAAAVAELLDIEGGFVDDQADRGGATKYGISLRFLKSEGAFDEDGDGIADFDLDFDGDIDGIDIRKLTPGDARFLYLRCFWLPIGADQLPRPLGEAVFDQAVNGGLSAGKKLLQRAVNQCLMEARRIGATPPALLAIDGSLGAHTRATVDWVLRFPGKGMPALIAAYRDAVRERYRAIARRYPSQQRFLRGWLARAERLGR